VQREVRLRQHQQPGDAAGSAEDMPLHLANRMQPELGDGAIDERAERPA
jgi:hypothetical protein